MRRLLSTLVVTALISGCSAYPNVSSPSPLATVTPSAAAVATATPTLAPTTEPTIEPKPTVEPEPTEEPCPTAEVLTVREFVAASWECFGVEDVKIKAWLDGPPMFGFEGPRVRPGWLYYPVEDATALWNDAPKDDDRFNCSGRKLWCPGVFPHLKPDSGLSFLPLQRWVVVTGHLRDPAAETCHYDFDPEPVPDLVEVCRQMLVVTAIRGSDAP